MYTVLCPSVSQVRVHQVTTVSTLSIVFFELNVTIARRNRSTCSNFRVHRDVNVGRFTLRHPLLGIVLQTTQLDTAIQFSRSRCRQTETTVAIARAWNLKRSGWNKTFFRRWWKHACTESVRPCQKRPNIWMTRCLMKKHDFISAKMKHYSQLKSKYFL